MSPSSSAVTCNDCKGGEERAKKEVKWWARMSKCEMKRVSSADSVRYFKICALFLNSGLSST
jgi:hypothetical protein